MKFILFVLVFFCNLTFAAQLASNMGRANGTMGFPFIYPNTSQKVTYDASTASTAFQTNTSIVRLICTTDCHVKFGTAPTAATDGTSVFMKANIEYYFAVAAGLSYKVAAIKDASGGTLYISEGG